MSETKTSFGWCRLILYIISAFIAYYIANRFAPIEQGLLDVVIALAIFLISLFLLMWLSRFICGMLGGKSSDHEAGSRSGRAAMGAAAAGVAAASTSSAHDDDAQAQADAKAAEEQARRDAQEAEERAKREAAAKEAEADKARKAKEAADAKAKKDAEAARAKEKADAEKAKAEKAKKAAAEKEAKAKADADKKAKADADKKAAAAKKEKAAKASATAGAGAAASSEGTKPKNAMTGARGGQADNLKEIKGIGPKLEKLCHSLGIYHFDQIADWDKDEIAWMDGNLEGFHGRVTRDNWVGQAKILAAGGETEFSQRVEDGKVY